MNRIVRTTTLANRSILGVASVATLALGGYLASNPTPKAGAAAPSQSTSTSTRPVGGHSWPNTTAPSATSSSSSPTAQPSSSTSSRSTSTSTGTSGGFAQPAPVQQTQQTPQSTTRAS